MTFDTLFLLQYTSLMVTTFLAFTLGVSYVVSVQHLKEERQEHLKVRK